MSRNVVNLDALIPRADLDAPTAESDANIPGLKIADLEPGLIYSWLRKPDFQRETSCWSPEHVADLISTFAEGNIIPAVVLWQNGQMVYVIDGAHRLSALIAWVRDDYGGGDISARYYGNAVPPEQLAMHETTKALVKAKVGTYREHKLATEHPATSDPAILGRASRFAFKSIDTQWIGKAKVNQAKAAFFRINQGGVKIDETETRILRANNSAIAISARSISRFGTGHEYWDKFDEAIKADIVSLGRAINKLLFAPQLKLPINTLDVPLAGFGYGSNVLSFAFDLVNVANALMLPDSTRKATKDENIPDDPDGTQTVRYLNKVRDVLNLICSKAPRSLGLHPALYFYTPRGEFVPAAFFNITTWFMVLESESKIPRFLKVRKDMEALILEHPVIVKPALHKLGSGMRSRSRMVSLFQEIFKLLDGGAAPGSVWHTITSNNDFSFLVSDEHEQKDDASRGVHGARFERKSKAAGFLREALPATLKCPLCGGLMHMNGMVSDHEKGRSVGGSSADQNARPVHPVCNSNR